VSYSDLAYLVTLRPLERPVSNGTTRYSPFRASWSQTVELLSKELRAHGARQTVLEVDMREQDFRLDGLPRANAIARTPGIVLSFKASAVSGQPDLRYEVAEFTRWEDNVRAVALGLQALRAVDRYGVTRRGEQYAGWKQLGTGTGVGEGNARRGRSLIEQQGGDVKAALFAAHPDHGGDPDDFRDVIAARDA
jgi:hypothetical protein